MQLLDRTAAGYSFTDEAIGATLGEALAFLAELGCPAGELIEVRGSGRTLVRGRLDDMAALAG